MPLMLGMGILIFSSMIAISQLFVAIGGPMVPDLLADMPTIFHYTESGQRVPQYFPVFTSGDEPILIGGTENITLTEKEFAESFPSLAMYGLTVKIALGIFVVLLMLAGLSYFFEEFNIVRQGTAYGIIAKIVILIPIYMILPYLWDATALVIESSSLYLMDPFGGDPHARTTHLWCMMGSAVCTVDGGSTSIDPLNLFDDVGVFDRNITLDPSSWNNALQTPIFGEGFIVNILLALFKGFAVMFMTAMMFVLSAVRVMLTEVIVISFPLVSAIGLIPWINTSRISDMFQQNLIGLAMAPIMSAIVLSVGLSTIDTQNMPPLRMWFQLLSVGFLAVFFPVMLSPMLGNLSSKVGNMVSSSITSASVAGSAALKGVTHGISQASSSGAANMGGLARGVGGGIGGGGANNRGGITPQNGRVSSADIGTAASGANLGGGISMMDKLKMYGQAGTIGMLGGLGSGLLQSSTQAMGVSGMQGISGDMAGAGDARIQNIAQNTMINGASRTIANQMIQMEPSAGAAGNAALNINSHTALNPGQAINTMCDDSSSFDAGQRLAGDPDSRQEFIHACEKKTGVDQMPQESRAKFQEQMTEQIKTHPNAAGKMFTEMKEDTTTTS